jgi:hypothetical protein
VTSQGDLTNMVNAKHLRMLDMYVCACVCTCRDSFDHWFVIRFTVLYINKQNWVSCMGKE